MMVISLRRERLTETPPVLLSSNRDELWHNLPAVYTQGLSCIDLRDARANRERLQKAFSEIDITYSS